MTNRQSLSPSTSFKVNEFFQGNHLLDPWHLLKSIKTKIIGDDKTKRMKLALIMEAIAERNPDDFYKLLQTLREDDATKEAIGILERRRRQIFYIDAESYFIGIRRNSCEPINDLIKRQVPLEVTIPKFLLEIDELDGRLRDRSTNEFDVMKEQMDRLFCDERIGEVLLNFERKIVERFLENYIKGLREFKLYTRGNDERTGKPMFTVTFIESNSRYEIRNWNCTCNEIEKTGVACPHLLLAAFSTHDKSYGELISKRWRKERPIGIAKELKIWLRRGPPLSTRRNTQKARRKTGAK
jgi:hypothetical protein